MENNTNQSRKRTRSDQGGEECMKESHKGKKPEIMAEDSSYKGNVSYEFYDDGPIGVFDFPWLKEGVIFKADEYLEPQEDAFGPCSYLPDSTFQANLDQSHVQNVPPIPSVDQTSKLDDDRESSWSFLVDDLEPVDCIWRCIVDQPLDIGLNKA